MDKRNKEPYDEEPIALDAPDGQAARTGEVEGPSESFGAIIAAILANIGIGVIKFIAAAISGSSAMVSEGIHSIVDSGNGLLLLFGMKRAAREPDLEHPFGYSHELYFWTLVVAVMIFALGGGFSIYEGLHNFAAIGPDTTMGNPLMSYIVIGASVVLEGFSLSVALRNFNKARGSTSPMKFIREAKDPSLFTVVLEDSAAELGLLVAFCGVFFGHMFNNPYIDAAASVVIGLLLCVVATILLRETKGLLIGEGMHAHELREIERIVEADPLVIECGRILTLYLGPDDLLITLDATFAEGSTGDEIDEATDRIERGIVSVYPQAKRIFIENENLRVTRAGAENMSKIASAADSGSS
ncbi:MAG: cation diffusion facilitator family transporter [Eggerthellaceae bacterium]|nr:cation diffusion facilitator family transporter [Eggerthellaceae bacterium]